MFNAHAFGNLLLTAGLVVAVLSGVAAILGRLRRDERLILASERAGLALSLMIISASLLLFDAFLSHDYLNIYVAHYSDNSMPWYYLLSAFWGGQDGSVLFWSLMLALAT
ncbi:heme lyase CcmF/NrfE family subunit, partial [Myxococcota bacterium]|nr:heme lyase CcmF/NrfE family subunit [Myxococcota bacterium]